MTHHLRRALILCTFFCAIPSFARAGIIDLIDQWSGPGRFVGYGIEWRLVCIQAPPLGSSPATRKKEEEQDETKVETETAKTKLARALGVIGPACVFTPMDVKKRRVASYNLGFTFYKSLDNHLWDGVPGVTEDFKRVYVTRLDNTIWWRFARSAELGIGGGVFWINGPAFESFTRVYLKPILVDFKPIAAFHRKGDAPWGSIDEWLSVRGGFITVPAGFTNADFGAPTPYKANREFNWTLEAFIDLEPFVRKLKS